MIPVSLTVSNIITQKKSPLLIFELVNVMFSVQFKHEQNAWFKEKPPNWL